MYNIFPSYDIFARSFGAVFKNNFGHTQIIKGTVPPDFSPLVFFFKELLLALVDKPSNDFNFFRISAEIFDFSSASPVSLTPAKQTILLQLDDSF